MSAATAAAVPVVMMPCFRSEEEEPWFSTEVSRVCVDDGLAVVAELQLARKREQSVRVCILL